MALVSLLFIQWEEVQSFPWRVVTIQEECSRGPVVDEEFITDEGDYTVAFHCFPDREEGFSEVLVGEFVACSGRCW